MKAYFCTQQQNFMPLFRKIQFNPLERNTFFLHFTYSIIEGVILGVLALNEFVFLKSLQGGDWGVSILFQFSVFVLTFSILLNEWARRMKNKKKFLVWLGIVTRAPLFLLLFFPPDVGHLANAWVYHYIFLAIFLAYYFANPIIYPTINQFLKTNYTHENFSVFYSYSTIANKIVMLIITFAYGWLLDYDQNSFRFVFPVISALGMLSVWLLASIRHNKQMIESVTIPMWQSIKRQIKDMRHKMSGNKPFRDFEVGFMYYGFAFMGTVSVIAIYFNQALGLNYSSVAFYKNSYNILAIVLLPLFGKLLGKMDPRKFSAITFASLMFYLLFIGLTEYFPLFSWIKGVKIYYSLLLAMFFNGIFAATMSLLWSIGSAYFCKKEEASEYQAIHLSFTGLRSFFAPVLGLGIYRLVGFTGTFMTGVALCLIAVMISLHSYKKYHLDGNLKTETEPFTDPQIEK
ncbi:MAG: MFS transporter [Bacteroidota bacterium]